MYCDVIYIQEWHVKKWINFIKISRWENTNLKLETTFEVWVNSLKILKINPNIFGNFSYYYNLNNHYTLYGLGSSFGLMWK